MAPCDPVPVDLFGIQWYKFGSWVSRKNMPKAHFLFVRCKRNSLSEVRSPLLSLKFRECTYIMTSWRSSTSTVTGRTEAFLVLSKLQSTVVKYNYTCNRVLKLKSMEGIFFLECKSFLLLRKKTWQFGHVNSAAYSSLNITTC